MLHKLTELLLKRSPTLHSFKKQKLAEPFDFSNWHISQLIGVRATVFCKELYCTYTYWFIYDIVLPQMNTYSQLVASLD